MKTNNNPINQTLNVPDEIRIIPYNLNPSLMNSFHDYAQSLSNTSFDKSLLDNDWSDIDDEETFKRLVVMIAMQGSVETYRYLEKVANEMEASDQKDWVRLGLIHAQMILEQSLMDTTIGFIVSGLGGEESRLRYNVVIRSRQTITSHLARSIHHECQLMSSSYDMICEDTVHFQSNYIQLYLLVPFQQTPELLVRGLIDQYEFLDDKYMESNMRLFEDKEIENWIKTS